MRFSLKSLIIPLLCLLGAGSISGCGQAHKDASEAPPSHWSKMMAVSSPSLPLPSPRISLLLGKDKPVEKTTTAPVEIAKIEAKVKSETVASNVSTEGSAPTGSGAESSGQATQQNPFSSGLLAANVPSLPSSPSLPVANLALPAPAPSTDTVKALSSSGAVVTRSNLNTSVTNSSNLSNNPAPTRSNVASTVAFSSTTNSTASTPTIKLSPQTFQAQGSPTLTANNTPTLVVPSLSTPVGHYSRPQVNLRGRPPLPSLPLVIPPKSDPSGKSTDTGTPAAEGAQQGASTGTGSEQNNVVQAKGAGETTTGDQSETPLMIVAAVVPVQATGAIVPEVNLSDPANPLVEMTLEHVDSSFYTDSEGRQRVKGAHYKVNARLVDSSGKTHSTDWTGRTLRMVDSSMKFYMDTPIQKENLFSFTWTDESTKWLLYLLPSSNPVSQEAMQCPDMGMGSPCFPLSETKQWMSLPYNKQEMAAQYYYAPAEKLRVLSNEKVFIKTP